MTHRLSGHYIAGFESSLGSRGSGTVQLDGASMSGGDSGFVFQGDVEQVGDEVRSLVNVTQHAPGENSIFGPTKECILALRGAFAGSVGMFSGHMVEQPDLTVTVRLVRVAH